ncbi:MAG: hypothetical protein IT307_12390, partial [Chloroflexi bacterium]|nr:hypothetical protein [Chloroflexota bacterium]
DAWSIGCRAYSFSRHQVRAAAETGRYPWLKVLDGTQHFVFLIDGVPVRFYRGDAEEPTRRTLRQQEIEAEQLSLAFSGADAATGLMFRLAVETDEASGMVCRVVFLALRGEEGQVECFWPVPLGDSNEAAVSPSSDGRGAPRDRRNDVPALQLPLPAGGAMPTGAAAGVTTGPDRRRRRRPRHGDD